MNLPRLPILLASLAAAAALAVAGCGGSSGGSSAAGTGSTGGASAVHTSHTSLGTLLVNGQGRTLYLFDKDTGPRSMCAGGCAGEWPPFTAKSLPKAAGGIPASALSLIDRGDGTRQVAIDGHPLYLFSGDQSAGQTNGQGLNDFGAQWWAVSPAGRSVTTTASSSSGGAAYSPSTSRGY
jgi:predicted lipoprotein with Yx(FWY)xxD motif